MFHILFTHHHCPCHTMHTSDSPVNYFDKVYLQGGCLMFLFCSLHFIPFADMWVPCMGPISDVFMLFSAIRKMSKMSQCNTLLHAV